jgi:hypothetical protein
MGLAIVIIVIVAAISSVTTVCYTNYQRPLQTERQYGASPNLDAPADCLIAADGPDDRADQRIVTPLRLYPVGVCLDPIS